MSQIGYTMMCEQAGPKQLVRDVTLAEQAGFDFAVISDHYSPWLDSQGHSPYAWSVLGTAAHAITPPSSRRDADGRCGVGEIPHLRGLDIVRGSTFAPTTIGAVRSTQRLVGFLLWALGEAAWLGLRQLANRG